MKTEYDVIVIGGGPGGTKCALELAKAGRQVALIEKNAVGGTCLNWGCIPSKSYLYMVELLENIKKSKRYGLEILDYTVNWEAVKKKKNQNVKILGMGLRKSLECKGVAILEGEGFLQKNNKVLFQANSGEEVVLEADKIVLALGSKPFFLPFTKRGEHVISSRELLDIASIPSSLAIIGGGVVGVEMASVFAGLGTKVTIIERLPALLASLDAEISEELKKSLERKGCQIYLNSSVSLAEDSGNKAKVAFETVDGPQEIEVDKALVAIGRSAAYDLNDFIELGFENDGRRIKLNDNLQTSNQDIYMIGDSAQNNMTAYGAEKEAEQVTAHIMGRAKEAIDYDQILVAVFCHPEVAEVGINEREALKKGLDIEVKKADYAINGKAVILGEREGLVKIILDKSSQKVLGVSIIGAYATDLIHQALLPVKLGLTVEQWLDGIVWAHPVLSELIKSALES